MTRKMKDTTSDKPKTKAPGEEVGYGRPPITNRFKPGQSGNPNGRPALPKEVRDALKADTLPRYLRLMKLSKDAEANGDIKTAVLKLLAAHRAGVGDAAEAGKLGFRFGQLGLAHLDLGFGDELLGLDREFLGAQFAVIELQQWIADFHRIVDLHEHLRHQA